VSESVCIDLIHLGLESAIGSYLIHGDEPTIVDTGPATTFERLKEGLAEQGIGPRDLRHVVLTHVHLDHAGAVGDVVEAFPEATVHVHEDGAPHVVDPTRLVASTRRTFGDNHDRLWGVTRPVPAERIKAWRVDDPHAPAGLRPVATPGHIAHHLAYLDEGDGTLYSGDSMGIVLDPGVPTHCPTPPPAIDLRAWEATLAEITTIGPERFGAAHFGFHGRAAERCRELQVQLHALEERVRRSLASGDESDAELYEEEVRDRLGAHMGRARVDGYFDMFPAATDWAGVAFYLKRNG
jgi:glyoxylase-like metal-dependent hydrolase (beta-lactamase superfamily II)